MKYIFTGSLILYSGLLSAGEEGALPRGKNPGPGVKYMLSLPEDPDGDCHSYHMNPEQGYLAYNPFSKKAYFLAKNKKEAKNSKVRSYVLELDLESKKVAKRLLLVVSDTASLMADREPTEAVTVVDFKKSSFACGQGVSSGVSLRWTGKHEAVKSFPSSRYKLVRSSSGFELENRKDHGVRMFDLDSMQSRVIATLPDDGIPLFLDLNRMESIQYDDSANGVLKKFDLNKKNRLLGELKLSEGMRIVQQQDKIAVAATDSSNKTVNVRVLKDWTASKDRELKYLSSIIPVDKVRLSIDFASGIGFLSGRHKEISREWRHAEIVNGITGQSVRHIKAPDGEYVAILELFPYTPWAIVITKSVADDSFGTISLYHLKEDRVEQITMK